MMPIRSMTGFAQVTGAIAAGSFTLSIKSVNHRFLDPHFRLPANCEALEMELRRVLKQKLARGHVDVNLTLDGSSGAAIALNRPLVTAYVQAFRAAAVEAGIAAEPDLNAVLRLPGALDAGAAINGEEFSSAGLEKIGEALGRLNHMRGQEGQTIERELRERMAHLSAACAESRQSREALLKS